ncbi:ABC transporter permease [Paenibacillus campinasensis]|uniref:ABC transporter permease n=1 Tax=Paenibacillus campinasensis TaxID=66347 RepID=A0A268EX42_9BACL|nr:ABC transporter permease [Paenibacillus campinasensis]PAD77692.1 ABC transporter permease [Paenibacillus campinasensis]
MNNFIRLVANENMKIYSRPRTWVMLGLLALFSLAMPVLLYLTGADMDLWTVFTWTESFTYLLNIIFAVVIASDLVAGEFSWGTIKLLLIRPWSRGKILFSKYIAMLLFGLLGTVILSAVGIVSSALLFSGNQAMGAGFEQSRMLDSMLLVLTDLIQLVVIATITFMLSTVFRSSSLAIGLSLLILFTKDLFGMLFNPEKHVWAKYVLLLHTDLSVYIHSPVGPGGTSLAFSIAILAGYSILFLLISWWVFTKRDVTT